MQATVIYMLSEQAQRDAMAAIGQPVARKHSMTIDITAEDLSLLPIGDDGTINVDVTGATRYLDTLILAGWQSENSGLRTSANVLNPPFLAELRTGQMILAENARQKDLVGKENTEYNRQATEGAYLGFLADPAARATGPRALIGRDLQSPADYWPEDHTKLVAEINRRNEADKAVETAAKESKEQAKREYINTWITSNAPPHIQEQYAAGLLARSEALTMIANTAFTATGLPEEHPVLMCRDTNCPCGIQEVQTIPPAIYSLWREIRHRLPDGTIAEFEESRDCIRDSDADSGDPYYTVLVKIPHGPFTFERRIKL